MKCLVNYKSTKTLRFKMNGTYLKKISSFVGLGPKVTKVKVKIGAWTCGAQNTSREPICKIENRIQKALKGPKNWDLGNIGTLNMIWILLAICGNAILYIWALGTFLSNSLITFCHFKILKKHTNRPIIVICKYVVFVVHRCFYCLLV